MRKFLTLEKIYAMEKPSGKAQLVTTAKKPRKVVKGPIRDASRTKDLMLDAFGEILAEKDLTAITIENIQKKSKRHKKLIYEYFGGLNQLKNAYEKSRNFDKIDIESENIADRLISEFDELCENIELQGNILWALNERRKKTRDAINQRFLNVVNDGSTDNQVAKAIVMAGLTYIALYAQKENSVICGIDVSTKEGKDLIKEAVKDVFK